MLKCPGQIAISSTNALYNYNQELNYTQPHIKSLCYGLYVEDENGSIRIDRHFPKTKALYIATMWTEKDIYIVANNGFYYKGEYFTNYLEDQLEEYYFDLYSLQNIYLIYLKGDQRNNVLLENFHVTYEQERNISIVSYAQLQTENVLKVAKGYTYAYSDNPCDITLLNTVNEGYAIGNNFDLMKLSPNVEHTSKYYFINKYIELYM